MAITMVREPSETPNINNVDDFAGLRYAYYGKNGCVKDFGNECSSTTNGNIFHINSGRLVLQGVECDIDANGVDITIDTVSATRYYVVYLQVNLNNDQVSILSTYSTSAYPTVSAGDDLTANNVGTARLPLYKFEATNGSIANVVKMVTTIPYLLQDYDFTNGTVEARFADIDERLTRLGFRQGSISVTSLWVQDVTVNEIKRQGNYVIVNFSASSVSYFTTSYREVVLGIISSEFKPKETIQVGAMVRRDISSPYMLVLVTIHVDGTVTIASDEAFSNYIGFKFNFGYEANPIT